MVGVALSGLVTTKLRPSARQLQAFSMFVSLLLAVSTAGYIFYGCGTEGLTVSSNTCAFTCSCDDIKYTPICGSDHVTYNSPCEAGCGSFDEYTKRYEDCVCIPEGSYSHGNGTFGGIAQDGPCKLEMCKYPFYFFLATQAATNFLAACTWTTSTIIVLRWAGGKWKISEEINRVIFQFRWDPGQGLLFVAVWNCRITVRVHTWSINTQRNPGQSVHTAGCSFHSKYGLLAIRPEVVQVSLINGIVV